MRGKHAARGGYLHWRQTKKNIWYKYKNDITRNCLLEYCANHFRLRVIWDYAWQRRSLVRALVKTNRLILTVIKLAQYFFFVPIHVSATTINSVWKFQLDFALVSFVQTRKQNPPICRLHFRRFRHACFAEPTNVKRFSYLLLSSKFLNSTPLQY